MIENLGWLLLWSVLVGLDLASVVQMMIARPLVASTVTGFILGDPAAGATVGVVLELFALEVLPVGASRYPDYGLGAIPAAAVAAGAPGVFGSGFGVAVGLVMAYLGGKAIHLVRVENAMDVRRHRDALDSGDVRAVNGLQLRCLGRDIFRSLAVASLGLLFAALVVRWVPLTVQSVVYLSVATVGAALAAAISGIGRLAGRKTALPWFALGLAGGLAGVLLV
ncbi:MAG: PTS sugar transporter subunit IIC [Gemmatimonadota bacterium]|nr:MAG: PTS sugar transporter subunit IIC [Gemmatimonadota bacterium]